MVSLQVLHYEGSLLRRAPRTTSDMGLRIPTPRAGTIGLTIGVLAHRWVLLHTTVESERALQAH
jgi:hypothetical protein